MLIVNLRPCMCHTRTLGGCICLLRLRCAGNRKENEGRTVRKLNTPLNNLGHVLFLNLLCRLFYEFCYLCLLYHQCLGDLIDYIWILVSLALSCEGIGILCLLTVFLTNFTKSHLFCSRNLLWFQPLTSETKSGNLEHCDLNKPDFKEAITNNSNCIVVN